ncbi:hypothetical protein ACHAXH_002292 [Discostella pseudostelligera]
MGGRHSHHRDAFTNDLHSDNDNNKKKQQQCTQCCVFCPIPLASLVSPPPLPASSSLTHSGHNTANTSAHLCEKRGGIFGTPIPDTPPPNRRLRDNAVVEKYYYTGGSFDASEEKKSTSPAGGPLAGRGGSGGGRGAGGNNNTIVGRTFGRGGRFAIDNYVSSSKYMGLEKEVSDTVQVEQNHSQMDSSSNRNGKAAMQQQQQPNAEIHDGPDAEALLYQKYELCEVLGIGSTSTCHRCIDLSTGQSRACKIVDKLGMDSQCSSITLSTNLLDQFYTEIKTLRSLRHPNIIQLYDVFITQDKIYIIMEFMSGGELFDYVVQKGTLTEEEASRIVRKVTSALVYMHSRNVIHRDMKPENLLLAHKPRSSHDIEVKIIDFGLSKILSDSPIASSFLGTRGYLAPEMIQRRDYTKSVDAWALGVIIFVLLCGCLPFDDDCHSMPNSPALREKFTLRFPRWAKDLSSSAKDLLNHLLVVDSRKRYTAEQAMNHPWVRGETASSESLLQSPGRIKPSPGRVHGQKSSQATKDHVSQMVANRAIANAQLAARSPKTHVRKTSI